MYKQWIKIRYVTKSISPTGFIYRLYTIPPIVEKIFFYIRVGNFVLEKQKRKQKKKKKIKGKKK